jgi:pimeloyl-ACP methyl ester carboxylesterase
MQPSAPFAVASLRFVCAAALVGALGACGTAAVDAGPTPTVGPSVSQEATPVSVSVDGRTIEGSCMGVQRDEGPTVVLEAGLGNLGSELNSIAYDVAADARVCSYDRAGLGRSSPARTPRTIPDLITDLHAFLSRGGISAPYVLVGHSLGGSLVIRYAQEYPKEVIGFVSMNPVPPYTTWIRRAREVETGEELQAKEIDFYLGMNGESIDLRGTDRELTEPIADDIPYVVMFAEDCPGDFCDRIRPALRAATAELSRIGTGGRFVVVPDSGHDIFLSSHGADIAKEIRTLLAR